MAPDAMRCTRRMAKVQCAVKVFMFCSQSTREEKALQCISIFVVKVYVRYNALLPTSAARNYLAFIKAFSFSVK